MHVKVALLFYFYIFPTETLARGVCEDVPIDHITEQQYNDLKGPDFCGDIQLDACYKVAIHEELIKKGDYLPFEKGYPKCDPAKIQFYDSKGKKSKTIDTTLIACNNKLQPFPIGRGQAANDIMMYDCSGKACEAFYNMPGVYSN